ncbi:MAG TPA: T9SS type A sorting domain-containing protein [Chitinophagales bacterium]|nr:T9SS type A sorting domain-containing protein [Chitinophagales bacterium]
MKTALFLAASIAICIGTAESQSFLQYYNGTANTPGNIKFSVIQKESAGVLILGSYYNSSSDNGIAVIKMSTSGTPSYYKIIKFPDNADTIVPTCIKHKGGVLYVGGYIYNSNSTQDNGFLLKYNISSNTLNWINIIQERSRVFDLKVTSDKLLICGEIYYAVTPDIEALLYSVNPTTGNFTQILQSHESNNAADTYLAMDILDDTVFLTGRFELMNELDKMRSVLVKSEINGNILASSYYLEDRDNSARMYGYDLVIDNNEVFLIATGDINGTNTNEDNIVYKTDQSGNLQWSTQVDEPSVNDGLFSCIQVYNHASLRDLIVWGSTFQSSALGIAKLTSVDDAGFINWSNSYDGIYSHAPNSANSMIVINDTIYAVGWFEKDDNIVGALLKVPASSGILEGCHDALDPSDVEREFEEEFSITNSTNTHTSDNLEESISSLSLAQSLECPIGLKMNNSSITKGIQYIGGNQIIIQLNEYYYTDGIDYAIYNTIGQNILNNSLNENQIIDLNTLSKGIYFIGLIANGKIFYSDKIIIY